MKANALICINGEEIATAVKLGLKDIPAPILTSVPYVFNLLDVVWSYKHPNGFIKIMISGSEIALEYNDELWNKIETVIGGG